MADILVPLARGFEETEAVTIVDILRRADIPVVLAGVTEKAVTGSHGIVIDCDALLESVDVKTLDGAVLPGGMPGATNLVKSSVLRDILIQLDRQDFLIAAVCAAPLVLEAAGVLQGKKRTSYPGYEKELKSGPYLTDAVVTDGNVITSRGPATALAFALAVVEKLRGPQKAEQVRKAVLY